MTDEKYNGWTNYETWNVKLWIDNDEATYEHAQALCGTARRLYPEDATAHLADMLQEWQEDDAPEIGASQYGDLLNHALGCVDWYEIAESYMAEWSE